MGECKIGKTKLIYECIQHLEETLKIGGFSTYFDKKSSQEKILYISPFNRENIDSPSLQKKAIMHWLSGNITVFKTGFDDYGSQLLQQSKNVDIIVMDELGRFEENAEQFKKEVIKCLDETIPILGVIRSLDYGTWLDEIKIHPNVTVLHVDKNNLDTVGKILLNHYCANKKSSRA